MKNGVDVRFVRAGIENEDEVFRFLEKNFFPDEPLNAALNWSPKKDDFGPLRYVKDGLTFMAYAKTDVSEEQLVGVVINKIIKREDMNVKQPQAPKSMKVFNILMELDDRADVWNRIPSKEAFCTVILSVSSDCRRLNIGRRLIEESLAEATSSGFAYAVVQCTSHYSARMVEKLGYERICEIRYDDFRNDDGEVIFKTSKPHESLVMFLKCLRP